MRVAYLVNQYPGISHTFVRREIQALERAGVEIVRFAIRPAKDAVIAAEDALEDEKTRHILRERKSALMAAALSALVARPLGAMRGFFEAMRLGLRSEAGIVRHAVYFVEALVLAAWLREAGLAHVHAHFGTNSATVAMLAARLSGARFSMTVHGPEEFDKPGLIALPEKIRRAAFVAGVSSFGVSQLRRLAPPASWDKIKRVRCGVERAFYEGPVKPAPDAPRLVSVARLSAQKGQVTLIDAAALLKRDGVAFEVRIIGDGEMRADLEAAIARAGVGREVVLAGWKTPAEVRTEIENAKIFILPSYAEGLPVSIMEAFFLSRPVISTYVAGIPELVRPGENGWLAAAGDAEALAAAMRKAISADPATIAEMGAKAREAACAMHDIDAIAVELKSHFKAAAR
jgi:glycosyltransferase involved in cell wall biosynthesis